VTNADGWVTQNVAGSLSDGIVEDEVRRVPRPRLPLKTVSFSTPSSRK